MAVSVDSAFESAYNKLRQVNRRRNYARSARALLSAATLIGLVVVGLCLVDWLFELNVTARIAFWVLSAAVLAWWGVRDILPALRSAFQPSPEDLDQLSRQIGRQTPGLEDALVNFLQIYRDEGIAAQPMIKHLSLEQLYQRFRDVDLLKAFSVESLSQPAIRLGAVWGALLLLLIAFPNVVGQTLLKLVHPTQSFQQPLPITLENITGDMTILKNETAALRGIFQGVNPDRLWLVVQNSEAAGDSVTEERLEIVAGAGRSFEYEIKHVKNNFRYWFEAAVNLAPFRNRPALSAVGQITVQERPVIRELQVKLDYPAYTRREPTLLSPNSGEITALKGTTASLNLNANKTLGKATIVFEDGQTVALQVREQRAAGSFTVDGNAQYRIEIEDPQGNGNYQPVQWSVFALSDEMPFVEITRPGEDVDLGDELSLALAANARDDFGFSRLDLKGRHVKAGSTGDTAEFSLRLPLSLIERNRAVAEYAWDLSNFYLIANDYIEYYVEVQDNDRISGPKSARSQTYIVRLPSILDVLSETHSELDNEIQETEQLAKESEDLREKLEEINREMKREQELTWERKQEIQAQLDRQKNSFEKLENIQKELEELISKMDQQDLLSPETLEKYMELQKMFQEMATPELMQAMEELQKALQEQDMEQVKEAMEEFEMSMGEFEERIERNYELFKKIQMEQKMDELVTMAEKLAEDQQQINEALKEQPLDPGLQEQLANQEEKLAEQTEAFGEQLEKAAEMFQEDLSKIAEELSEAAQQLQEQNTAGEMQQMQSQIRQGEQQQARQSGQQIQQQLQNMQNRMNQAQQEMTAQQKEEVMQAMQNIQQDLLRNSFEQERLMQRSRQADMTSTSLNDIARRQDQLRQNLRNITGEMVDLSRETFHMSSQMSQLMEGTMGKMGEALEGLSERNPQSAGRAQQQAMAGLNRSIMMMQSSMEQLSQSSSSSGFQEFMEAMQQMAGEQGQLNQQTMGMFQQQQGGSQPSPQMLSQLRRQQEMIRRSMEQLNQQNDQGSRKDL
ncbi:MAG TPA: hypothetical protein PLG66_11425, partial [Calditrichia bacterium]|nr:hypothetical protein [Calditrichia bacterium]